MESHFLGSIKLIPLIYGITAVISFMVALVIKGLFTAVSFQTARATAEAPLLRQPEIKRES